MKPALGISAVVFLAVGVSAQTITHSFGSVVFPGGTAATTPGVTRNFGSVVFPGGAQFATPVRTGPPPFLVGTPFGVARSGVRPITPALGQNFGRKNGNNRGSRGTNTLVYAYPVFVGNYYDSGQYAADPGPAPVPLPPVAPVAPPAMSMYPTDAARPVMIPMPQPNPEGVSPYQPQPQPRAADEPAPADHYLLAFKDHSVYTAVAYWFDGDTLHYFTTGSTHNQASVSLLDRELTMRLNKELGIEFHMPDAK
jgi:hypothetical protein